MMKKLKLLLLPIMILSLTACGSKSNTPNDDNKPNNPTSSNELQAMIEKMNSADNYHLDYEIDMAFKSEGIEMEMPITMKMDFDNETNLAKAALTMSILGMNVTVNEYMDLTNNITYVENPEDGTWTKQKSEPIDTSNSVAAYKNAKKVDETDSEYHYQITATPDEFEQALSLGGSPTEDLTLEKDVTIDIYVNKTNDEIRIESDLKEAVAFEEDIEYTKLKFTMTFNNLNKSAVSKIDQSIIDNAVEE